MRPLGHSNKCDNFSLFQILKGEILGDFTCAIIFHREPISSNMNQKISSLAVQTVAEIIKNKQKYSNGL